MGFPIPYAGVLPKILLTAASSMASIREICTSILRSMGISIPDEQSQDQDYIYNQHNHHYYHHNQDHQYSNREAGPWLYMTTTSAPMPSTASTIAAIQQSLPSVLYETLEPAQKQGDPCKSMNQQQCAVCLCEIGKGQRVRALPRCSHVFHTNCIDAWLGHSHRTCPLCRTSLVTEEVAMMEAQEVSDQFARSWLIYQEEEEDDEGLHGHGHGHHNVQNLNHFHNFFSSQNFN